MNKYYYILLSILLFASFNIWAQNAKIYNHAGKHFFYSIPGSYNDTIFAPYYDWAREYYEIIMTSKHRANVQLHFFNTTKGNPSIRTFVINPGETISYNPDNREAFAICGSYPKEVVSNKSLEIIADSNIVVQVAHQNGDGMQLLPVDNQPLVTKYRLLLYSPNISGPGTYGFAIVAACDSVVLRITPSCNTASHYRGAPFDLTLNKGETYDLEATGELAGTLIEVVHSKINVPVCIYTLYLAVFGGSDATMGNCCGQNVVEQILPVSWWDTLTPVSMLYHQKAHRIRILSDDYNNRVYFDNRYITTLQAGTFLDAVLDSAVVVHTSKPAGIVQMMLSGTSGANALGVGDPDIIWATPASQGIKETYFRIMYIDMGPWVTSNHAALNIISPTANINNIRYDFRNIASYFQPFPGDPSWQYAHIPLDSADTSTIHHLVSPQKITAHIVHVFPGGGYSYNLSEVNVFRKDTVRDTLYKCAGSGISISAPAGTAYKWSTGDTIRQIYAAGSGHYQVTVITNNGCETDRTDDYDYYVIDTSRYAGNKLDTLVCFADSLRIQLDATGWNYLWNDSQTTASRVVRNDSTYTVQYYTPSCIYHTDTFKVKFYNSIPILDNNFRDCNRTNDKAWIISPDSNANHNYIWMDNAGNVLRNTIAYKGDTFYVPRPESYNVVVQSPEGCTVTFPFTVPSRIRPFFTVPATCEGKAVSFSTESTANVISWFWDFGDGNTATTADPIHTYSVPGSYKVMLITSDTMPCIDTAYATIVVDTLTYVSFKADRDSLCVGSLISLLPSYRGRIDNLIWSINSDSMIHNGVWIHSFDKSGVYVVVLTGKSSNCDDVHYADTLQVWPSPIVALRDDTTLCPNQSPVLLMSLVSEVPGTYKYLWSTGATSERISITMPGDYWLSVISEHGCITTDTVLIKKSCYIAIPNAFTPNGDGVNDYFFPRDLLSPGVSVFHMRVYNRWGAIIFETNNTEGKGWDGKYNDVSQLQGVYVYLLNVTFTNGIEEQYKGNVTLIR